MAGQTITALLRTSFGMSSSRHSSMYNSLAQRLHAPTRVSLEISFEARNGGYVCAIHMMLAFDRIYSKTPILINFRVLKLETHTLGCICTLLCLAAVNTYTYAPSGLRDSQGNSDNTDSLFAVPNRLSSVGLLV